jgi:hypothetical protein
MWTSVMRWKDPGAGGAVLGMDREDSHEAPMLALPLLTAAVLSQGFVARFGTPPDLGLGQKVKLRIAEATRPLPRGISIPRPRLRQVILVGTLTAYRPLESVTVRRSGWIAGVGPTNQRTVDWVQVMGIEVPQRRNALNAVNGAAGGLGAALGWGLMAGIFDFMVCGDWTSRCKDKNAWHYTKQAAIVAIPVGIVVGYFSTRWKRVY